MCTGLWVVEDCVGGEEAINGPVYQWPIISLQNVHQQQQHKQQENPEQQRVLTEKVDFTTNRTEG